MNKFALVIQKMTHKTVLALTISVCWQWQNNMDLIHKEYLDCHHIKARIHTITSLVLLIASSNKGKLIKPFLALVLDIILR